MLGLTIVLLGSVSLACLACLAVVKCSSLVLAKSNWIELTLASLYRLVTARSRTLTFLFRLFNVVVSDILLI